MTDPFQFFKEAHLQDDPTYRAPQAAIDSWTELAELARAELARMGFAASVLSGDEFQVSPPAGAHVVVNAIQPFGATLDWHAPVMDTTGYQEKIITQNVTSGLFRYVVHANEIIVKAMLDVLKEAGFRTLMDHEERDSYHYRVLEAPKYPLA